MTNDVADLQEFNEKISQIESGQSRRSNASIKPQEAVASCEPKNRANDGVVNSQMWAMYGDSNYSACEKAVPCLPPGQYTINTSDHLGIYFSKADINLDELVKLPDSVSEQVISEIEAFWGKEDHFRRFGFLWKRGVLMWGPPGSGKCLVKGTPVLMFNGTIKSVEDIVVGDVLMGDDSTPRNVLSLARGREHLYAVHQQNGDTYGVNESHVLSLVRDTLKKGRYNPHRKTKDHVDISVKDYLQKSSNFKKEYFGYKVGINFPTTNVTLDPYFLGLWLGDGTSSAPEITTADPEIVSYLKELARTMVLRFVPRHSTTSGKADTYSLSGYAFEDGSNPIRTQLKELNLLNNKHIPHSYKTNNRQVRLQLLAGLIDSDGYMGTNCFEFSNTNKQLVNDVVFLARSLGFKASVSSKRTTNQSGKSFESQSVHISGHINTVPTLLTRKRAHPRQSRKDPLHTSIELESLGEGDYYGFEIDGNHRFVLGDFTVTHNTSTLQVISERIITKGGIAIYVDSPNLAARGVKLLRQVEKTRPLVMMLEDIDAIIETYGENDLLALMDGELQIDNVVFVATTNYPERLDKRFINRPSRFDIVKKIGMPSAAAREIYLKHKNVRFSTPSAQRELMEWVELTKNFSIAHMKELIVSVEVFGVPLNQAVARLRTMMEYSPKSQDGDARGNLGFSIG